MLLMTLDIQKQYMNNQTYHDGLAEAFEVETSNTYPVVEATEYPVVSASETEKEEDLQYVRANLYDLIEKGSSAATNALAVANESQHPRAYEVAGNLIKSVADLTDKLVSLQKAKLELNPEQETKTNINVDKAVFVGSTAELLKALKKHAE